MTAAYCSGAEHWMAYLGNRTEPFVLDDRTRRPGAGVNFDHGTTGRYTQGCRCAKCKTAARSAKTKACMGRVVDSAKKLSLVPHGLNGYKNYGCRCDVCKAAKHAEYEAKKASR